MMVGRDTPQTRGQQRDQVRLNRWARLADEQLGDWLAGLGATYAGAVVEADGTRMMRWILPAGANPSAPRRCRELLARALDGDVGRWELVYQEVLYARCEGPTRYFGSAVQRCEWAGMAMAAAELVQGGLAHYRQPVATCGHSVGDGRLLPGVFVVVAIAALAFGWWGEAPLLLLGLPGIVLVASCVWLGVALVRRVWGLPGGSQFQ